MLLSLIIAVSRFGEQKKLSRKLIDSALRRSSSKAFSSLFSGDDMKFKVERLLVNSGRLISGGSNTICFVLKYFN